MKYIYYLTEKGKELVRVSDTKSMKNFTIHVFDKNKEKWILNYDFCGIYSDDIPADVITESEAEEWLRRLKS